MATRRPWGDFRLLAEATQLLIADCLLPTDPDSWSLTPGQPVYQGQSPWLVSRKCGHLAGPGELYGRVEVWSTCSVKSAQSVDYYSYRRATMGSRRAAFRADHMPKKSPTLTATTKPVSRHSVALTDLAGAETDSRQFHFGKMCKKVTLFRSSEKFHIFFHCLTR